MHNKIHFSYNIRKSTYDCHPQKIPKTFDFNLLLKKITWVWRWYRHKIHKAFPHAGIQNEMRYFEVVHQVEPNPRIKFSPFKRLIVDSSFYLGQTDEVMLVTTIIIDFWKTWNLRKKWSTHQSVLWIPLEFPGVPIFGSASLKSHSRFHWQFLHHKKDSGFLWYHLPL